MTQVHISPVLTPLSDDFSEPAVSKMGSELEKESSRSREATYFHNKKLRGP
jgi:hypothetical protein